MSIYLSLVGISRSKVFFSQLIGAGSGGRWRAGTAGEISRFLEMTEKQLRQLAEQLHSSTAHLAMLDASAANLAGEVEEQDIVLPLYCGHFGSRRCQTLQIYSHCQLPISV